MAILRKYYGSLTSSFRGYLGALKGVSRVPKGQNMAPCHGLGGSRNENGLYGNFESIAILGVNVVWGL